jgi:hypothetical protein
MSAVAGFPGLSELLAWPTDHLTQAADYWETIGERCYGLTNQVWQDTMSVDWHGEAAEALRSATHADMLTTSAVADQLQSAAKTARGGASDLYAARSRMQYAVEDARTAGFDVSEDLDITDRLTGATPAQHAARQAQAQTLAGDIRQRATQLVALDQQVADKITAAVAGIRDTFPQNPTPDTPPKPEIHAIGNHWKQDPPPQPPPRQSADSPWKDLPSPRTLDDVQDSLRQLRRGKNPPVRELDTPEEIRDFWDWLAENARDLPPRGDTTRKALEDGTEINLRPHSTSGGTTIEIILPKPGKNPKVHLPLSPFVDDPPQLPTLIDAPPMPPAPPEPGHPLPAPLPPTQFTDPASLPPWLKNPSPPGFSVSPAQQPPVFEWDRPDALAPPIHHPATSQSGGPSWWPQIGHDLGEASKKTFEWLVIGGIIVGGLFSVGGNNEEVPAP